MGQLSGRLPLTFEANLGQTDPRVKFLSRGVGLALFLTGDEAVLVLREAGTTGGDEVQRGALLQTSDEGRSRVVRMRFLGTGGASSLVGLDSLPGHSNYFVGSDPRRWRTEIPLFERVKYERLYPGVDVIFRGPGGGLEYDLVVAPGANPDVIRVGFEGTGRLRIDRSGNLILPVGRGQVVQHAPLVYQEVGGTRRMLSGRFALRGPREIGFVVSGSYDPARALVIDPVLSYSTFLGGAASGAPYAIAVDGSGSVYITGSTGSTLPLENALQPTPGGSGDVFVTKMNPSGDALVYSTYLGGIGSDVGRGIALDSSGSAYVTGSTGSTNFPVINPFQAARAGGGIFVDDGFVAKLAPDGSALIYSTYLGGGLADFATAIAVDGSGRACVAGYTSSGDFPLANPLQTLLVSSGWPDAFVTKLTPAGNALVFSTPLGGQGGDQAAGIAVDPNGNCYVTGYTNSPDFPTVGPLRAAPDPVWADAFVTKINASGTELVYSALLGGSGLDQGTAIAVDASGSAYVAGYSYSPYFPIRNPLQVSRAGSSDDSDAFAAKINPEGSGLVYSTFLGGSSIEFTYGIAVDAAGQAHVVGETWSPDFPQARPLSPVHVPDVQDHDGFVTKLSADGGLLAYSTCLGGDGTMAAQDYIYGIAVDASGSAYLAGFAGSLDFPGTAGVIQPFSPPAGFVAKIEDDAPPPGPTPVLGGGRVEDNHVALHYDGSWFSNASTGHSGASSALGNASGLRVVITFKGSGIRWIGYRDEWSGLARVSLDGLVRGTLDTYSSPEAYQSVLYEEHDLADEIHTLVVEPTGTHNPLSGGAWIWVDAFDVIGGISPNPDGDGDGVPDSLDCAPADRETWRVPSPAESLDVSGDSISLTLVWQAPWDQGGAATRYDVLQSANPADFMGAACIVTATSATSLEVAPGQGNEFYLVRSRNACGGILGADSTGSERPGASCP